MLYPEFIADLAKKCADSGISVAIDTAGNVPWEHFEKVLPYTELFLYDIKALDPSLHRAGTGVGNALILKNLDELLRKNRRVIIRTPVIPGYNDGDELHKIRRYCGERGLPLELLTYHTIGETKRSALKANDR